MPTLCGGHLKNSPFMLSFPVLFLMMHFLQQCMFSVDLKYQVNTSANIKMSQFYISHRTQFLRPQSKMRVSPLVTLGNVQRRGILGCGPAASSVLRQLVCKLKRSWKQVMGWHRSSTPKYSYDFHSYCLNFSDGPSNDHIPPRIG